MSNTNYEYETSDLGLATALIAAGLELVRIEKNNPRRATFVFDNSEQLHTHEREYWADELFVSALKYSDTLKRLKARLYS